MSEDSKELKIPKGFEEDLIVSDPKDVDMIEISNKFLKTLEIEYSKFKKKISEKEKENNKYLNHNNFIFTPEDLNKNSPTTIINAPWGTGKTYFIEKFLKNFIDKKITSDVFQSIIIVDAWKHSTHDNIPNELINEILNNLFGTLDSKEKAKTKTKELFEKSSKFILNSFINAVKEKTYLDFNNNETKNQNEKALNEVSQKIKPTIIFIDNIERIGPNSWEIMKGLIKLSKIDNLLIVLPMNIRMLDNKSISNNEYSIEKYIDITYFNFRQDYYSIFSEQEISEEEKEILVKMFNYQNNGRNLTLREVIQRLRSKNINSIKNPYKKYFHINKNIWESEEAFKPYIISNIEEYVNILDEININYQDLIDKTIEIFQSISKGPNKEKLIEFLSSLKLWSGENYTYSINHEEQTTKYFSLIKELKKYLEERTEYNLLSISFKQLEISESEAGISSQRKQIETSKKKIEREKQKTLISKNQETIVKNENIISKAENDISSAQQIINQNNSEIKSLEDHNIKINDDLNHLNEIKLITKEFESYSKDSKVLFSKINKDIVNNKLTKENEINENNKEEFIDNIYLEIKGKYS